MIREVDRFMEQTELEIEQAWDKEIEEDITHNRAQIGEESSLTNLATKQSIDTIKSGERIMEAIDLVEDDRIMWEQWKQDEEKAKQEMDPKLLKEHLATGQPLTTPPTRSPIMLGKDPSTYLLGVISKIRVPELETSIMVLPLTTVIILLKYIEEWISTHQELILCCRVLFFLLNTHQVQISANKALLQTLHSLQHKTRQHLQMHSDIMSFNLTVMDYMKRQYQQSAATTSFWKKSNKKFNKKKREETKKESFRHY